MKTIYIIRHGTTIGMEQHIVQGSSDSPLSDKGLEEAQATAIALQKAGIQHIFTSPQRRAVQTAYIIANCIKVEPVLIDELREMDFGKYEGMQRKTLQVAYHPFLYHFLQLMKYIHPKKYGENLHAFRKRVHAGFEKILTHNQAQCFVLIGHTGTLWLLLSDLAKKHHFPFDKKVILKPCSISKISVNNYGKTQIDYLNDISHLSQPQAMT